MTHHAKVEHARAHLARFGIGPGSAAPPIYRFLWRLGSEMPPPHFQGPIALSLMTCVNFIVIFAALTWLWRWRAPHLPAWVCWSLPVAAGLLFGLLLALAYKRSARLLHLPDWKNYPPAEATNSEQPVLPAIKADVWVRGLFGIAAISILIAAALRLGD
jgi:hypothetical protein